MYIGGRRPFGWTIELSEARAFPIEHPAEQLALVRIRTMRDQGLSLRKIADALVAAGRQFSHVGIADVLRGETGASER